MKKPTNYKHLLFLYIMIFMCGMGLMAQTLNKPTPIQNPNFGNNGSPWTAACASASFNEYYVKFTWSVTPAVNSDNTFVLEMSDANGSFTNPTSLTTVTDKNTISEFNIRFVLPTTTRGTGYKLRVKSTSPVLYSPETIGYNMYYVDYKSPIQITENGSGQIGDGTISVCTGAPAVIKVDNVPNSDTYQYIWRKSSTVLAETSSTLTVTESGMYSVEIDYGPICSGSAGTLSNLITVKISNSLGVTINTPTQTSFCPGEYAAPLEATIANNDIFYTWYKDGVEVQAKTLGNYIYSFDTTDPNFSGDYTVKIESDEICTETSPIVNISKTEDFNVSSNTPLELILLPSQTKTLGFTTSANSPSFQWYKDGTAVSGATTNSLTINQAGNYYLSITQGGTCNTVINSDTIIVVSPVSFEITTEYTSTYADCTYDTIGIQIKTINAITANGTKTDVTLDVLSDFVFQWKKDNVLVSGATSSAINLTDISENGSYLVEGSLSSFTPTSNVLNVTLKSSEEITIDASSTVICNNTDAISLSTSTDLSNTTFSWYKDGVVVDSSSITYNTTIPGNYYLSVTKNGCSIISNEINVLPLDESLITVDSALNIVLLSGIPQTINASGGTAYEWLDSTNTIVSNTSTLTISEEGTYTLIGYLGACTVTKQIVVTLKETFKIPNVITVNGDGINDLWLIPNTYSRQANVNVIIYNDKGEEVFNVFDYQNNWPESSTSFSVQNMVFYYKIKKGSDILKQGTITVIK